MSQSKNLNPNLFLGRFQCRLNSVTITQSGATPASALTSPSRMLTHLVHGSMTRHSDIKSTDRSTRFFASKPSLDGEEDEEVPAFSTDRPGNLRSFRITEQMVHKVLSSLNPSKSVNGISPRILRECSAELTRPVTRLFKKIAKQCEWPSRWKTGRVSAIWKKASKSAPKNYRPITVLDNLSLCFERAVDKQLTTFLSEFTPDEQFGFKKGCGTSDYSAVLTAELHLAMEATMESNLVALDVAGAFDKVWWKGLLAKLKARGCDGKALKLLQSYFKSRFLYVVAMGVASALSGVPQGGIWSPKLWNFYIQDLVQCLVHSKVFKYADDCTALKKFAQGDREQAITELNADLKRVSRWGKKWKTTFEPAKTHGMLVTNAPNKATANVLKFGDAEVKFETELKIVGVTYDHKLKCSKMAAEMASRGRKALGFLYRLGDLISPRDLETIYKYFVRSSMEFGNASYIGAAPTNLDPLDATQRRAEKPSGIKMHSLSARRDAVCVGLLCKILDGECVKPVADAFSNLQLVNDPVARGRDASKVHITNMKHTLRKTSLNTFKRCFIARAHDIFDSIPEHLIERGLKHGWTYS